MSSGIQIVIKRRALRPNLDKFTSKMYNNMHRNFMSASKDFAEAMMLEVGAHVDTGMSFGSTVPMGRAVKSALAGNILGGLPKKGYTDINSQTFVSNRPKSFSEGIRLGRHAFELFFGSKIRPIFKLRFSYTVFQHMIHDAGYQTPAWRSLSKAIAAFKLALIFNKARITPQFRDYMEVDVSSIIK